jgi:hypothetical protein
LNAPVSDAAANTLSVPVMSGAVVGVAAVEVGAVDELDFEDEHAETARSRQTAVDATRSERACMTRASLRVGELRRRRWST